MNKRPLGNPPTFKGFAFHLGDLIGESYFKFNNGNYSFMGKRRNKYQMLTIRKFYGISYRLSWFFGFWTISNADEITEDVG